MHFVIIDSPNNLNLEEYLKILKTQGVTDLVRACASNYDTSKIIKNNINIHDLSFPDGTIPSEDLIAKWLKICKNNTPSRVIAIHCIAGLGRAPLLVAIALVEHGMDAFDAIQLIRSNRKGALNHKQVEFLHYYRVTTKRWGCC